jgi:hypothetical protein
MLLAGKLILLDSCGSYTNLAGKEQEQGKQKSLACSASQALYQRLLGF